MTALNQTEIETLAPTVYEQMAQRLLQKMSEHTGPAPFNFMLWLSAELEDTFFTSPEQKVAYLMAVTGIVHEYLENEHGIQFKPNT